MDLNQLITLNREIDELPRPQMFLRDRLFGGRAEGYDVYTFGYDAWAGKKALAPFVNRRIGFKLIERPGYVTRTFNFPLIAPLDVLSEQDVMQRVAGEAIGGGISPAERQNRLKARQIARIDDMITRREEAMIGEMITSGTITIAGDGVSDRVDFSTLGWTLTDDITDGSQDWDAATSEKLKNLRAWKHDVYHACGIVPDTVIMGSDAAEAFLADTDVLNVLDKRNVSVGQIEYRDLGGAEYLGNIFGLALFAYSDGYVNDQNATVEFINGQYVIVCCSAARVPEQFMAYGPYHDVVTNSTFAQARILIPEEGDRIENVTKWKMVSSPLPYVPYTKSWKSVRVID